MPALELPIRRATQEDLPRLARAMGLAFGGDPTDEELPHMHPLMEYDRARCAIDDGEIVGTLGALSFELAVPGAIACASDLFAWDPAPWCPEIF